MIDEEHILLEGENRCHECQLTHANAGRGTDWGGLTSLSRLQPPSSAPAVMHVTLGSWAAERKRNPSPPANHVPWEALLLREI